MHNVESDSSVKHDQCQDHKACSDEAMVGTDNKKEKEMIMINQVAETVKRMMMGNDASHDWLHVIRVRNLALEIAVDIKKTEDVDLLVVELGALLHDVFDHKYIGKLNLGKTIEPDAFFRDMLEPHIEGTSISREQIAQVIRIATNVSYSKEKARVREGKQTEWHKTCKELHCVQDADMLDAMGSIGIMRTVAYSCTQPNRILVPSVGAKRAEDEKQAVTYHFEEKLLKLKDCMKTQLGKRKAVRRHKMMEIFLSELDSENQPYADSVGHFPLRAQ